MILLKADVLTLGKLFVQNRQQMTSLISLQPPLWFKSQMFVDILCFSDWQKKRFKLLMTQLIKENKL